MRKVEAKRRISVTQAEARFALGFVLEVDGGRWSLRVPAEDGTQDSPASDEAIAVTGKNETRRALPLVVGQHRLEFAH